MDELGKDQQEPQGSAADCQARSRSEGRSVLIQSATVRSTRGIIATECKSVRRIGLFGERLEGRIGRLRHSSRVQPRRLPGCFACLWWPGVAFRQHERKALKSFKCVVQFSSFHFHVHLRSTPTPEITNLFQILATESAPGRLPTTTTLSIRRYSSFCSPKRAKR